MISRDVEITNRLGLHARAAAKLVKVAAPFRCDVELGRGDEMVDAKSILGLLLLAAGQGSTLTLRCDGDDEEAAVQAITELIESRFGEDG